MTDKTHRVLDGELAAADLNPQEADVLAQSSAAIRRVLQSIPQAAGVDVAPRVMERIRAAHRVSRPANEPAWKRAFAWLWSPRSFTLQWRPAYAGAFAILTIAATLLVDPAANSVATSPREVLVQFRLDAPQAHQVQLAGNFTSWKTTVSLKRSGKNCP